RDKFGEKLYEAWYNTSLCRQKLGQAQPTTSKKHAELETAKSVVETFVRISVDIPEDWWKKFDRLYRQIQSDLGQSPSPLERPTTIVLTSAPAKSDANPDETASNESSKATKKKEPAETAAVPKSSSGTMSVVIFLLIVVGGGGASVWMMMSKQSRKRPVRVAHDLNMNDVTFTLADDQPADDSDFDIPVATMPRSAPSAKKSTTAKRPGKPKGT
ncbi:MAG: Uncharacterized protein FD138_1580, partial [Planctomycetota bacterium]